MAGPATSPLFRGCAFAALGLGVAFEVVRAATDVGGPGLDSFTQNWVYQGIEFVALALCVLRVIRRREQRLAWTLMSVSLAFWTAGDLTWSVVAGPCRPPA